MPCELIKKFELIERDVCLVVLISVNEEISYMCF